MNRIADMQCAAPDPVTSQRRTLVRGAVPWMLRCLLVTALLCGFLSMARPASAAFLTDVADSFDYERKNPFDFRLFLSYRLLQKSAVIAREQCNPAAGQRNCGPSTKDQYFAYAPQFAANQTQHALMIRPAFGLYKDLEVSLEIPVIFSEVFTAQLAADAQVNGSSLRRDGVVTRDSGESLHGPGLGDLKLGLRWGIFNDDRDWTKATWVLGFNWTIPTGTVWDPKDPRKGTGGVGVGRGAHAFSFETSLSKRWLIFDPYVQIRYTFFVVPQSVKDGLQQGLNSESTNARVIESALAPSQRADITLGTEFVFWENRDKMQKIALDVRMFFFGQFEGRDYTIFTDFLADFQPTNKGKPLRTSLITDHEQYFGIGGQAALHFNLAKYGFIRIAGSVANTLPFFITSAKRGVDKNGNRIVDAGTDEEYPYHVRELDGIGKRIQQRDTFTYTFQVFAGLTI